MTAPEIKGYCPGALRPMRSGDGIVVRVRPFGGRLEAVQAQGIASLSKSFGNGILDLSSRANIQIRGVWDQTYGDLIDGLRALALLDDTAEVESRRNILVTPFWQTGEETATLAQDLATSLTAPDAPAIPGKFGFAVDTGAQPCLQAASADIRLERDAARSLILVADGMTTGKPVTAQTAVVEAMALARWFLSNCGTQTRMAKLTQLGVTLPSGHDVPRSNQDFRPAPAVTAQGAMVGLAFGQISAETLAKLAGYGPLRLTPWRMMLIEGARDLPEISGVLTDPSDPLLRVLACSGAPACAQALDETRALARMIAPHAKPGKILHVSGCAKGCAHPRPAPLTITATRDGYDLIQNGRASDPATRRALSSHDIIKAL